LESRREKSKPFCHQDAKNTKEEQELFLILKPNKDLLILIILVCLVPWWLTLVLMVLIFSPSLRLSVKNKKAPAG